MLSLSKHEVARTAGQLILRRAQDEGKVGASIDMAKLLKGRTGDWEVVIGLEVHAQATTKSKLFSGASTEFGAEPNTQVSLVDAAMPGMLPVLNEASVRQAVRTGLALNARINRHSVFARKNYFYPDLPHGYQISQYEEPIVGEGAITIDLPDGETKDVGIERLHLEQDAGKSLHDQNPTQTYIDLNRAGVTLMEIVSKPDMRSSDEAAAYVEKLRSILRYIGACDGNMQEGSLRADANVSVRRPGEPLGTRCEIKNVNSIRFLKQAIDFEAARQIEIIEDGGTIDQETRLFDAGKGETRSMRSKEDAHDYRYFPDPDLLPVVLEKGFVEQLKETLPELPDAKKARFISEYGLSADIASVLVAERETADEFEKKVKEITKISSNEIDVETSATSSANIIINQIFGISRELEQDIPQTIRETDISGIVVLEHKNVISGKIAKEVLEISAREKAKAADIVKNRGLEQITDTGAIEGVVDAIIAANPGNVAQYQGGNQKVIGWFVGQVMKETRGKANPKLVNELLRKKLAG
jgi:aspartyl-tRNA(Asn)/glutamyl-tRNA(Gln) amidotransferase subunit B